MNKIRLGRTICSRCNKPTEKQRTHNTKPWVCLKCQREYAKIRKMNCEICKNLDGLCNKHKPPETLKEREQRKSIWIVRATSHFDSPKLRREAAIIFEKANPIKK